MLPGYETDAISRLHPNGITTLETIFAVNTFRIRESPSGISPLGARRTVRESLLSYGSHHATVG